MGREGGEDGVQEDKEKEKEKERTFEHSFYNIFRSKDDIRDCGGVQALCRLLSLSRDPLVLQHILASLASLSFDDAR